MVLSYAAVTTLAASYRFFIATSSSMEPSIYPGDLIVADPSVPFSALQKGDIILFHAADGSGIISHRVVKLSTIWGMIPSKHQLGRSPVVITQGDANSRPIYLEDLPVTQKNYIGKATLIIHHGGQILEELAPRHVMKA